MHIYKDTWMLSSVGRASPLQGEGRGFESPSIHHFFEKIVGRVAKWPNAVDCKSIPNGFGGSNLPLSTICSSAIPLGYSQAVRHQTLTLTFPWFESTYPSH